MLLILVDDLRPELACYGAAHVVSPNIDQLAREGRRFTRHYVQAPTCGASRYAFLIGRYARGSEGRGNDALARRARAPGAHGPSLPQVFREAGYTTVSVGKVSHHPGGRMGPNWDSDDELEMPLAWTRHSMPSGAWGSPRGAMHGLADGLVRRRGETPAHEAADGPLTSYPDGLVSERALAELETLADDGAPFLLAVGFLRPHLPFGVPARFLGHYEDVAWPPTPHPQRPAGPSTWHASGEFFGGYDHGGRDPREDADYARVLRTHYAACVTYVDHLVGQLLERVRALGLEDDTIVVLWGDHGWHLGEHDVWGKHTLFEESLRTPLVMRVPGLPRSGDASAAVVESVDLFPTLCELVGLEAPSGHDGTSLLPQLEHPEAPGRAAVGYRRDAETLRTERFRLVRHLRDGATAEVELYDHGTDPGETLNVADVRADVVAELLGELERRLR